jgi:hypothetical protein
MSEKYEKHWARAAQKLTGDPYMQCLNWIRKNKEKVDLHLQAMRGSGTPAHEEVALYYQEETERMYGE